MPGLVEGDGVGGFRSVILEIGQVGEVGRLEVGTLGDPRRAGLDVRGRDVQAGAGEGAASAPVLRAPPMRAAWTWAGRATGPWRDCLKPRRPFFITPIRWARRAMLLSWVTRTMVRPRSRHMVSSRPMISSLVSSSRLPVGSSASRTLGSLTRARAMATRCCWPPDSSPGTCRSRSPRLTASSAMVARCCRAAALTRSGTSAVSTFSRADSVGIRLKVWNTNPISWARTLVTSASRNCARSRPSNSTMPADGRSRPPRICSSVDLPCPVGPWTASHSPSSITRSTPRRAATVSRPLR